MQQRTHKRKWADYSTVTDLVVGILKSFSALTYTIILKAKSFARWFFSLLGSGSVNLMSGYRSWYFWFKTLLVPVLNVKRKHQTSHIYFRIISQTVTRILIFLIEGN
jgi:hypothetical protein